MKNNMRKIKALMIGGVLTLGFIGSSSLDAYAATKSVQIDGYIPSIMYSTSSMKAPKAYLCTYNAQGKFLKKYQLSVKSVWGNKYRIKTDKSINLDDKTVKQVCLQVDNGTSKYSARKGLTKSSYKVEAVSSGKTLRIY